MLYINVYSTRVKEINFQFSMCVLLSNRYIEDKKKTILKPVLSLQVFKCSRASLNFYIILLNKFTQFFQMESIANYWQL